MTVVETARIRTGRGRIRVLRVIVHGGRLFLDGYEALLGPGTCQSCGCTQDHACPPTCSWANGQQVRRGT